MQLTDLATIEEWIRLEKEIGEKSGLSAGVYNKDGVRITGYKAWANQLCPLINGDVRSRMMICAPAHQNLAGMAKKNGQAVVEECDAGFTKVVVPIFVGEAFVGAAGGCGRLSEGGNVELFMAAKALETSEEEVEKMAAGAGTISEGQIQELIDFINGRIEKIVADYQAGS